MAILTQRNFKDVCIYEDMAGAIFVLFLFGFCLLLVSIFSIGLSATIHNYSHLLPLFLLLFVYLAWLISVWKHLCIGIIRLREHLFHDKFADQARCLRGTLLNDQHPGLLALALLLPRLMLYILQPAEPSRHILLLVYHSLGDCHCHALL